MTAVCLINRKGGVGKTTLTLALSDFLSGLHRKRVLLVDLDPQANLTTSAIGVTRWAELDKRGLTVADAFQAVVRGETPRVITDAVQRVAGGIPVQLVPSTPRLSDIESEAMETDQAWRRRVGSPYLVIHQLLSVQADAYDYVLIDCPPSLGVVTLNGLALADGYLMPVKPDALSTAGLPQLVAKVTAFASGLRRPLRRYGTVLNDFKSTANLGYTIRAELAADQDIGPLWDTQIGNSVKLPEGVEGHTPKTLTQRWTTALPDLNALTQEFLRRVR